MIVSINKERLAKFEGAILQQGVHKSFEEGGCAMEWAAFLANLPHTDHPKCVSHILGAFVRRFNDLLDEEGRQKLKPFIPKLLGTAASETVEQKRGWMAADWCVRVCAPAWLELAGLSEQAVALRALPEVTRENYQVAREVSIAARTAARALRAERYKNAAADAAADADAADAADAAYAAAAAAYAAAAAAYAATAAADVAELDAAAAAAAASDTAYAAAAAYADAAKLRPTTIEVQKAGFELLKRMIAAGDAS